MEPEMLRSELSLEEIAALEEGLKRDFYTTRLLLKNLEEELTDRLSLAYLLASTDESSE
jgi:N-glycosylase/DNA lyase